MMSDPKYCSVNRNTLQRHFPVMFPSSPCVKEQLPKYCVGLWQLVLQETFM